MDKGSQHFPRSICVFCASAMGVRPEYRAVAVELGEALAAADIGLVYGGAKVGLMGTLADSNLAAGGRVVGVMPQALVDMEVAHGDLTELHVVSDMHQRKALLGSRSDAFIALPGGFGTLEELFEVLAWFTLGIHAKPVVLLNTLGFYDGLLEFLDHCVAQGMLKKRNRDVLLVAPTVEAALSQILERWS